MRAKANCSRKIAVLLCALLAGCNAEPESIEPQSDVVFDIYNSPSDELWVATDNGVARFGQETAYLPLADSSKSVWAVAIDSSEKVWLATAGGTYVYRPEGLAPSLVDETPASALAIDPSDAVWVGTPGYGVFKIVDEAISSRYTSESGLPSNDILCLLSTSEGTVWVGTSAGLAFLEGNKWEAITAIEGKRVFDIASYHQQLIAASEAGGYASADQVKWKVLPGTEGRLVTAIQVFKNDLILGTGNGGLIVYPSGDTSRDPVFVSPKVLGLSQDAITSIAARGDQTILFGSFGGGVVEVTTKEWDTVLSGAP